MTNKPMEQRVAEAFGSLTTNLPFERIAQAIPDTTPQPKPLPRRRYAPVVAVAACVALVLSLGGLWHHLSVPTDPDTDSPIVVPPVTADSAVIDIDVNPSVELTVDTAECISAVTAVNTDAALLLSRLDLTQQPLAEGVQTLLTATIRCWSPCAVMMPPQPTVSTPLSITPWMPLWHSTASPHR